MFNFKNNIFRYIDHFAECQPFLVDNKLLTKSICYEIKLEAELMIQQNNTRNDYLAKKVRSDIK